MALGADGVARDLHLEPGLDRDEVGVGHRRGEGVLGVAEVRFRSFGADHCRLLSGPQTAPDIVANCPDAQWCYGYGFWTNDHGKLWPNLPRDSFAASGAGQQHIWVWPQQSLVIVQSPGLWKDQRQNDTGLIARVVDAMEEM